MNRYEDDRLVTETTAAFVKRGFAILQSHKLATNDTDHVAALLDYLSPPPWASILDAGCGVGAVADLMSILRPDLRFTLLNISAGQLNLCPKKMPKLQGDFHAIPTEPESFDVVMFNFSLGHGTLEACFSEVLRVLRPSGILFIYDLTAKMEDRANIADRLGYFPHTVGEIRNAASGFAETFIVEDPSSDISDVVAVLGHESFVHHGFDRMWPIVCRFVKS